MGNATVLLRLGPFTLLTDPNFLHAGQRAYLGYGLFSKRLREPALDVAQLPRLDLVLLSHLHGDHWDRVAERGLDRGLPVVTTPAAARTLGRRGFRGSHGLDTWASWQTSSGTDVLRVTSLPGRHAPGPLDRLLPPVMGSLVQLERAGERLLDLYISGDTLNVPELREIVRRFDTPDVAVVHLGGTKLLRAVMVTMDGRQGADLMQTVDAPTVVPVHTDDYTVFTSPLADFERAMARRGLSARLRVVERGETLALAAGSAG
ncbi:MAG TPA: MBL fold metallo-hydrolase [Nocardioidaceae bacterium]|nr:MBL fold metallo-hydrolase [Nocardioidaceae bacterium]